MFTDGNDSDNKSTSEGTRGSNSLGERDSQGRFSTNLLSLQLQLGTLLEDAGGSRAMALLDALAGLAATTRESAITAFMHTIQRLTLEQAGAPVLLSSEEKALQEFEEGLYRDILLSLVTPETETDSTRVPKSSALKVLSGEPARETSPSRVTLTLGRGTSSTKSSTVKTLPLTLLDGSGKKEGRLVLFPAGQLSKERSDVSSLSSSGSSLGLANLPSSSSTSSGPKSSPK